MQESRYIGIVDQLYGIYNSLLTRMSYKYRHTRVGLHTCACTVHHATSKGWQIRACTHIRYTRGTIAAYPRGRGSLLEVEYLFTPLFVQWHGNPPRGVAHACICAYVRTYVLTCCTQQARRGQVLASSMQVVEGC